MAHDALAMIEYRNEPAVFLYGAGESLARARRTAALVQLRVAGTQAIDAAPAAPAPPVAVPVVEVEAESPGLLALLDRLQAEAEEAGQRAVLFIPAHLIDLVAARAWHRGIEIVPDADERKRAEAMLMATVPRPELLQDVGREGQALLQKLSEDVGRLANMLASLSDEETVELIPARVERETGEAAIEPRHIRALIRARRLRDQYFSRELFADPAWDMLLDLMAARLEKTRVAVSSLCIAAAVPATTALRWIKALTDRGLFLRAADPQDGRRVYIELSEEAARAVTAYLRAVQRIAPAVI